MSVKPNLALTTAYARTHLEILPAPVRKVTREKLALVRVYKSTFKHWTSNLPMTETVRKLLKKRLKSEVDKCLDWSHGLAIYIHMLSYQFALAMRQPWTTTWALLGRWWPHNEVRVSVFINPFSTSPPGFPAITSLNRLRKGLIPLCNNTSEFKILTKLVGNRLFGSGNF